MDALRRVGAACGEWSAAHARGAAAAAAYAATLPKLLAPPGQAGARAAAGARTPSDTAAWERTAELALASMPASASSASAAVLAAEAACFELVDAVTADESNAVGEACLAGRCLGEWAALCSVTLDGLRREAALEAAVAAALVEGTFGDGDAPGKGLADAAAACARLWGLSPFVEDEGAVREIVSAATAGE